MKVITVDHRKMIFDVSYTFAHHLQVCFTSRVQLLNVLISFVYNTKGNILVIHRKMIFDVSYTFAHHLEVYFASRVQLLNVLISFVCNTKGNIFAYKLEFIFNERRTILLALVIVRLTDTIFFYFS